MVGVADGDFDGEADGARDEEIVGKRDGIPDGSCDMVGERLGMVLGKTLGGGVPSVGTAEGGSDCPPCSVGTDEGESEGGPAVGAKVCSTSLARHVVSVANCSQSKRQSVLPG
jgi:hypothetical protein